MNVALVIPALNESECLQALLPLVPASVQTIVVDNGSDDDTYAVALRLGAVCVWEPTRGYGTAVQAGLRHLASAPPDVVAIMDADLSHLPSELDALLAPLQEDRADMVLADRTALAQRGALTWPQRLGNVLATRLIAWHTGHHYRDMGPFRALHWDALLRLELRDPTWGWNVEMQMRAAQHQLRIEEISLPYRPRAGGVSKISGTLIGSIRAGVRILLSTHRYRETQHASHP
jgi:glycosyltransferase involved in cell wall biosynthesis